MKKLCCGMWIFVIGGLELSGIGSELELNEGEWDFFLDNEVFGDDDEVRFEFVVMFLFFWEEVKILFWLSCL